MVLFVGNSLVFVVAGSTLAAGLPEGERATQTLLSRNAVRGFVGLDAAIVGIVLVIGVVIPLYAASRDRTLHATSLSVVAAMVFLPGLISAVVWGLRNWQTLDDLTARTRQFGVPITVLQRAGGDWATAKDLDDQRVTRLHQHLIFLRDCVLVLMTLGLGHLALTLLG